MSVPRYVERIEPEPDPGRAPVVGDHYISPTYGVAVEVVEIEFGEIVYQTRGGVRYRSDVSRFARTHRRIVRTLPR